MLTGEHLSSIPAGGQNISKPGPMISLVQLIPSPFPESIFALVARQFSRSDTSMSPSRPLPEPPPEFFEADGNF